MPKPIRCILLVDDDPDDNFLHQLVIEEADVCDEVHVFENGSEALRFLAQPHREVCSEPDVILLDINMPGINGFEFMDAYQRLVPSMSHRPVVLILTTSSNPADRARANQFADVSGYHVKPLTPQIIQEVVQRYFA
ncbi:MAG: response regulator [Cytophagaceae bacterium]|nr:response regulator [Cytophagaceae bacterium]